MQKKIEELTLFNEQMKENNLNLNQEKENLLYSKEQLTNDL